MAVSIEVGGFGQNGLLAKEWPEERQATAVAISLQPFTRGFELSREDDVR
jgi:hypothetical protein